MQTDFNKDIFYAPDAWRLTIRGVRFKGRRDQISLGNMNLEAQFLLITACRFNYSKGVAIRFHKETHSTSALVEKCAFRECMQAMVAVSDQVMVRDCWITSSREIPNQTVIENHAIMSCENIICVTLVNGQGQRWIDNHSLLVCRFCSFGGEGGGFTPVVNFGSLVVLNTCQTVCGLGNAQRSCTVYSERIPSHLNDRTSTIDYHRRTQHRHKRYSQLPTAVICGKSIAAEQHLTTIRRGIWTPWAYSLSICMTGRRLLARRMCRGRMQEGRSIVTNEEYKRGGGNNSL